MNARLAYSAPTCPPDEPDWDADSAVLRNAMIREIPALIAGVAFTDALLWVVDEHIEAFRDGDVLEFARRLENAIVVRLCESDPQWTDLTTDDQQIIAAECRAELRRYRASRPIPTALPAVAPPRAPAYLTAKGE